MSESIEAVCLKDQFLKHSIKTEELRRQIRLKLFDLTKEWFKVTRENNHTILLTADAMRIKMDLDKLNLIKEIFEAKKVITDPGYSQQLRIFIKF